MLTKEKKSELIGRFGSNEKDSGSVEVQVALLTERINSLSPHFGKHKHDYQSNRGLLKMIGRRRSLLRYLAGSDVARYQKLIEALDLRK
jgi:small subunit ribosomal protein S15